MARRLRSTTKLARLILGSGKQAYVVAAEARINYSRLLDYANGRVEMSHGHRIKLARYFDVDPVVFASDEEQEAGSGFESTWFDAQVLGVRTVPGGDAIVSLSVGPFSDDLPAAWTLADAAGLILDVRAYGWQTTGPMTFTATVEDLKLVPSEGVEIRLRVPPEERDVTLSVGWFGAATRFQFVRAPAGVSNGS